MRPIISFLISLFCASSAFAATISSENTNRMKLNETKILFPITITAENAEEITAKNGINLLVDTSVRILWNNTKTIQASGLAVVNGRIAAEVAPEYRNDYTVLHIPVLDDFRVNEDVTLTGVTLRGYNRVFSKRFLGLDYTGDLVADAQDINAYFIENIEATDQSGPFPATNFAYQVSSDRSAVTLTWRNPPDYDLIGMEVEKTVTRNNQTAPPSTLVSMTAERGVTDKDIQVGDQITYTLFGRDLRNSGEPVSLTVVIEPATNLPNPPDKGDTGGLSENPKDTETIQTIPAQPMMSGPKEIADLEAHFSSYKTRYRIKCLRHAAVSGDSACMWAKIDLAYTQEKLGRTDIKIKLTARDLKLIKQRIGYAAKRYAKSCVAQKPAPYCNSLDEALSRANYFLKR